jgi:type IV conjugative transfer system coupling protein TraD
MRERLPQRLRANSANTNPIRNAGHFTRGSQLIGHDLSMWMRGARVPPLIWLGSFVLILWLKLVVILDDHEFQMISMRTLSAIWDFIDFDPMKRVNLTLQSGNIIQTPIGYVPYVAEVRVAWSKLMHSLLGSLLFSTVIAIPFSVWFILWSKSRSKIMLNEHHERGVELVDADDLIRQIDEHNTKQLRQIAADEFPKMSYPEAMDLPFERRKRVGLVTPYKFGTLPYPMGHEQTHAMIIGTTGAGKTTAMRALVKQAIERGESIVLFDLTGHYMEAFYKADRDKILNLNDARCCNWTIFNDCRTPSEYVSATTALIPADHGSDGGFWEHAARSLIAETCMSLQKDGLTSNEALSQELFKATLAQIHKRLAGTVAGPFTAPDASKLAQSVRAVVNAHAAALRYLPTAGEPFSIKKWIEDDAKGASILFITAQYAHLDMSKPLLTLWMNIAINTMMTLKHTRFLRTWFMFDELGALHQLPSLARGLQTARSFGGAFVLGVHSFAGLRQVYGDDGARNIISLTGTKMIMRTADRETAEELSKIIGYRKVRTVDESYSYGAHATRDASTLSATTKEEALVIADDITSLQNLHAFVRFPEHFPSTYIRVPYVKYPAIAEGFVEAEPPPPLELDEEGADTASEEGGGQDRASVVDLDNGEEPSERRGKASLAPNPLDAPEPDEEQPGLLRTLDDQERQRTQAEKVQLPPERPDTRDNLSMRRGARIQTEGHIALDTPLPKSGSTGPGDGKVPEESTSSRDIKRELTTDLGDGDIIEHRTGPRSGAEPLLDPNEPDMEP